MKIAAESQLVRLTLVLGFVCSVGATAGICTTVVVLRSPNEIVIATDSKINYVGAGMSPGIICKIHRSDNLFWSSDGYYKDRKGGFDLPSLVETADRTTAGSLYEKMVKFEQIAEDPMRLELEALKKYNPTFFKLIIDRGKFIELMFARFDTTPNYVSVTYSVRLVSGHAVIASAPKIIVCPGEGCPEGRSVLLMGHGEAIKGFLGQNTYSPSGPLIDLARTLIGLEIKDVPDADGPPIEILRITKHGAWMASPKDKVCQDLEDINLPLER